MNLSKNSLKVLLFLGIALLICGFIGYRYAYKPHQQIEDLEAKFNGQATVLLDNIKTNPDVWQNSIVIIEGTISNIDANGVTLDSSIYCQFKTTDQLKTISVNDRIQLKGRVMGYDDLLEELKLDQSIWIKTLQ